MRVNQPRDLPRVQQVAEHVAAVDREYIQRKIELRFCVLPLSLSLSHTHTPTHTVLDSRQSHADGLWYRCDVHF